MTNVLGINLNTLESNELWQKIIELVTNNEQNYIVTPNPEIILASHRDEEFFYILNKADLSLADGFGLKIAGMLSGHRIPRITGADISPRILALAETSGLKVVVINWDGGLSGQHDISQSLQKRYPDLEVLVEDVAREGVLALGVIERINNFGPKIMFCTFGFPHQEKFIYHNLKKFPSVSLALGVGGAFDFITKKAMRAPGVMRWLGLEWLWRLIIKPRRIKRIYQATFVFCIKLLKARFLDHLRYRSNVACLLYRKGSQGFEALIVEREDDRGHWQLPQGGTDGQNTVKAGYRELTEELNTNSFITRGSFKNVYKYKFKPEIKRTEQTSGAMESVKKYRFGYKGQKQSLYIAEFQGQDNDIKINFWDHSQFKWVALNKLVQEVHPVRQKSTEVFLNKFKSLNIN